MNSNWVKVYTTSNQYEAEIIKQSLIENEIPAVVMNKQDSSYMNMLPGVITVLVHPDHVELATAHISQTDF